MSEESKAVAEALALAMMTETDGYHFYKMAAKATEDDRGREGFELLAGEELKHLRLLKKQRDSYLESGKADPTIKVGTAPPLSKRNPIFSDALKSRIGEAHFEMSALSIGIQLELRSLQYYRECSREASDDEVLRDFYEELADWEAGHHEALTRQLEELKEDYWTKGGFAPW